MRFALTAVSMIALIIAAPAAVADEGMWTFDNSPSAKMRAAYGFAPDQAWLDRVRAGAGRIAGCSAALVSSEGLIQTNHHCVESCLEALSSTGVNYIRDGFFARARAEEKSCPGGFFEVLTAQKDVSTTISTATSGKTGAAYTLAYDGAVAQLESACKSGAADRRCQVVKLYQGGQHHLYTYKRYDDVRLVFAPEEASGFFGGDPDNFNFPRYNLDVGFLRAYENGAPAATPNHLRWRSTPLQDGEMVFVVGNPGTTSRQLTMDQLAFQRDRALPMRLATLSELRGRLIQFSSVSEENARIASGSLLSVENSLKGLTGRHMALMDQAAYGAKAAQEQAFQRSVQGRAEVRAAYADIAAATKTYESFYLAQQFLEARPGQNSPLMTWARTLVRGAQERAKPDGERLPEFSDARLTGTARALLADNPAEPGLQELLLSFWGSKMRDYLTADDPLVRQVLGNESPEALAQRLVAGTKLADPAERKKLWDGGAPAIAASTDPMIVFARQWDQAARALRARHSAEVEGPINRAQESIAKARFNVLGASVYPDATFTLRLSYGKVAGWTEPSGRQIGSFTRISGLYGRATGAYPFKLAPRWAQAQSKLNGDTIFNFSSTNDIIGGNSGSPVLDKDGHVVGAAFDGNIHSLGGEYFYDGALNRTVSVASTAIEVALRDVYGLDGLVAELKRD